MNENSNEEERKKSRRKKKRKLKKIKEIKRRDGSINYRSKQFRIGVVCRKYNNEGHFSFACHIKLYTNYNIHISN